MDRVSSVSAAAGGKRTRDFAKRINRGTTNSEVRELTKLTLRSSEPEDGASSAPPESPTRREIPIHLRLEPPDYEKELHRRLKNVALDKVVRAMTAVPGKEWELRQDTREFRTEEMPVPPFLDPSKPPSSEVPRQIRQCVDTYTGDTFYLHNDNTRHTMRPRRKGPDAKRRNSSSTEVEAAAKVAAAMNKVDPTCIFHLDHLAAKAETAESGKGDRVARNVGDGGGGGGGSAQASSNRYSLLSQAAMDPAELLQESDELAKHILKGWTPPPITRPGIMKTGGSKASQPGTDQKNRKARAERRTSILDTLEGDAGPPFPLDRFDDDVVAYTDSPYTNSPGTTGAEGGTKRFMVECSGYQAGLFLPLNIEPHFASVMLFDAKKQVRISENFYFDLNDQEARDMLPEERVSPSETLTQAIFTVNQDIKDVFIVFRFEKVLEDPAKAFEAYSKVKDEDGVEGASEKSRKAHAKLSDNASAICQRRGEFRMPFAWAAIPLGDPVAYTGGPNSPTANINLYQQSQNLSDEDLGTGNYPTGC